MKHTATGTPWYTRGQNAGITGMLMPNQTIIVENTKGAKVMALSGSRTTSETIDWVTLVAETEGEEYPFFEHDAYEFTRITFREDDNAGVYNSNPN